MPIWLGPPGNLKQLPYPSKGLSAPRVRAGAVHTLASGGMAVDSLGRRRHYNLAWQNLGNRAGMSPSGVLDILERMYEGAFGPGPFALIDSARTNILPANLATATSTRRDTVGWSASWATTPGALASVSTLITQTGNIRGLSAPMTSGTGVATVWASPTASVPVEPHAPCVLPSLSYTGSVYAAIGAGTGAQSAAARITWFTAAGVVISTTTGTVTALSTSSWTRLTVTATSPSNAAYALLSVLPSSVTMPSTLLLDGAQLEQAAAVTGWLLGTGVPRVVFDQLGDGYPLMGYHDVTTTLLEVG